eukprot:6615333-Ditylum_brightwellii.AAC.1
MDKVTYKDLNAFVNTKVTAAFNKAKKKKKVDDSTNEESNHEVNALAAASNNDSNSNSSRVPSNESGSNSK